MDIIVPFVAAAMGSVSKTLREQSAQIELLQSHLHKLSLKDAERSPPLREQAKQAYAAREYMKAAELYDLAIVKEPQDPATTSLLRSSRAACFFQLCDYQASLKEARLAIEANPANPKAWLWKAATFVALKFPPLASRALACAAHFLAREQQQDLSLLPVWKEHFSAVSQVCKFECANVGSTQLSLGTLPDCRFCPRII